MTTDKDNNTDAIKQIYDISPTSLDKYGFNWTLIIISIIISLGAFMCLVTWKIFDTIIPQLTIIELKSFYTYVATYVAGLGSIPVIKSSFVFINKLIKNQL